MSADLFAAFSNDEQLAWAESHSSPSDNSRFQKKQRNEQTSENYLGAKILRREQLTESLEQPLWSESGEGTQVLFDADQDDFGEFEDVVDQKPPLDILRSPTEQYQTAPTAHVEPPLPAIDLLDLDDGSAVVALPNKSPSLTPIVKMVQSTTAAESISTDLADDANGWGDFEQVGPAAEQTWLTTEHVPVLKAKQPNHTDSAQTIDDEWQDFEDGTVVNAAHTQVELAPPKMVITSQEQQQQRPYNVPPPAILLGILPSVFDEVTNAIKHQKLTDAEIAASILVAFHVSGRVIAGRSLRWKRDTVLTQSMKISQAGKSGGMKLTAINKGETTKEEREAAEAVESWSRYAHQFNSALSRAKIHHQPMKVSLSMPIKTIGGVMLGTGVNVCSICGLKRSERVWGVDVDLQDLFGEFWMTGWGHKDCSEFWYQYKYLLDHR